MKSYPGEYSESIEGARVRGVTEYVADVGNECDNPGGVSALICAVFSEIFVRLIMLLICSFCCFRCSLLVHHAGLLYSHLSPRCLHALHWPFPSSHFFLRSRHVKQPTVDNDSVLIFTVISGTYLTAISDASWCCHWLLAMIAWEHLLMQLCLCLLRL